MRDVRIVKEPEAHVVFCAGCHWIAEFPRGTSVAESNRALVDALHTHFAHQCKE